MRRRTASISIVALVLVLVVLGGVAIAIAGRDETTPAGSSTEAPITILWIGDTTGPVKAYGDVQLAGVLGAADYFNEHGGIAGRRVVVDAVSDNGDPAIAASALTRKLAAGEPTMVWAGSTSVDGSAMIPILARNEVFSVALTDGGHCEVNADVVCPHHWTLSVPNSVAPQTAVNWIEAQKFTKAGILEPTTSYSAEVTQGFETSASAAGISVDIASFPPTAVDLAPQMQELKQKGAQVVFAEGIGSAQYAFAAREALRWDVPLLFDPSASALDLTKLTAPENLTNSYLVTMFGQDATVPLASLETMVRYASKHADVTTMPLNVTGTGWDAVVALNAAVRQAGGSTDVEDLDRAMLELPTTDPLRTLTHRLGFTPENHQNVLGTVDDYAVIPVGPLVNGRVQPR